MDHHSKLYLYLLLAIALLSKAWPYLAVYFSNKKSANKGHTGGKINSSPRNFGYIALYDIVLLSCSFYFFMQFITNSNKWILYTAGAIAFLLWEWLPQYIRYRRHKQDA